LHYTPSAQPVSPLHQLGDFCPRRLDKIFFSPQFFNPPTFKSFPLQQMTLWIFLPPSLPLSFLGGLFFSFDAELFCHKCIPFANCCPNVAVPFFLTSEFLPFQDFRHASPPLTFTVLPGREFFFFVCGKGLSDRNLSWFVVSSCFFDEGVTWRPLSTVGFTPLF